MKQTTTKTLRVSVRAGSGSNASPREDRDSLKVGFGDVNTSRSNRRSGTGIMAGIIMLRMKHGVISA